MSSKIAFMIIPSFHKNPKSPLTTEVIGTYGGNQAALRIDGVASRAFANLTVDTKRPPRTFSVWMSDDAYRVPFRIVAGTELGDVTIDLVDYQRP